MTAYNLNLLCDPRTHEALELQGEGLINVRTGERYPVRNGIPDFLRTVSGQNKKYQELYDRIAVFYDLSEKLYVWLRNKGDLRREYIEELEVIPGARILEVSVGTGSNLRYFPASTVCFGLDLSWGMLWRCRKNLHKWNRTADLFHGEAEHLPFCEGAFDVVFHVGGINFFNDKPAAVQEMIRVAKPGTKIVIVDETEKVVKEHYEKTPLVGRYFKKRSEAVGDPLLWVPSEMREVSCKLVVEGKMYCLMFRKP
jgi:ubiquinone/menaquinone biosynthesis C-methylase UbiE